MKDMWEERYAPDEYAYGHEPNAFFKACTSSTKSPTTKPCSSGEATFTIDGVDCTGQWQASPSM